MTISRVCTVVNSWQILPWDLMSKNNRQKFETKSMFIHAVVLQRGLPSLEGKNELFVGKKRKKQLANSSQTDYS